MGGIDRMSAPIYIIQNKHSMRIIPRDNKNERGCAGITKNGLHHESNRWILAIWTRTVVRKPVICIIYF